MEQKRAPMGFIDNSNELKTNLNFQNNNSWRFVSDTLENKFFWPQLWKYVDSELV